MPSTTCELDIIPTKFLKNVLMHCIPALTKVGNLSLSSGHFFKDWKLAIVRPLIKSLKRNRKIQLQACKQSTIHIQSCWKMHTQPTHWSLQQIQPAAWVSICLQETLQLWDQSPQTGKWYSVGNGKQAYYSCHCHGLICGLWHC